MNSCPLCGEEKSTDYHQDKHRAYRQCANCQLVWVPAQYHLSPQQEKAEYDKHQNNPQDPGYRQFLARCFNPLATKLKAGAVGLDFGCGPGPAISAMAADKGYEVTNYDPIYFNSATALSNRYEFITLTEVIEHVAAPDRLLEQLDAMLKPSAILAIMTKRVSNQQAFSRWHYKNDPTHICFYSDKTFQWIGQKMNWQLEIIDKDVVFFYPD